MGKGGHGGSSATCPHGDRETLLPDQLPGTYPRGAVRKEQPDNATPNTQPTETNTPPGGEPAAAARGRNAPPAGGRPEGGGLLSRPRKGLR